MRDDDDDNADTFSDLELQLTDDLVDVQPCVHCGERTGLRCSGCGAVVCLLHNCPAGCDQVRRANA